MFLYWSFIASFSVLTTSKIFILHHKIITHIYKQTNKTHTNKQTTKHDVLLVIFRHGGFYDGVHDSWNPGATCLCQQKKIMIINNFHKFAKRAKSWTSHCALTNLKQSQLLGHFRQKLKHLPDVPEKVETG